MNEETIRGFKVTATDGDKTVHRFVTSLSVEGLYPSGFDKRFTKVTIHPAEVSGVIVPDRIESPAPPNNVVADGDLRRFPTGVDYVVLNADVTDCKVKVVDQDKSLLDGMEMVLPIGQVASHELIKRAVVCRTPDLVAGPFREEAGNER